MALTTTQRDNVDQMCISAVGLGTAVYNLEQAQPTGDVVGTTDAQTLTNKTLTEPIIDDTDAGVTITSADQTNASATVTIPDIGDAADNFVMEDTAQTLTNKTLRVPVIYDGDTGLTVTSADQTHATPTATIPDIVNIADEFVMAATAVTLTNKTIDGDDNTLSDIATASLKSVTGSDTAVVTGTAGTDGYVVKWNADGDAVDGVVLPTGALVGTTDTQELTNKTLGVPDDSLLTLGTTTATAETKITMEFDETTAGVGSFVMGTSGVPQVLNANPGSSVHGIDLAFTHSAGDGDCDYLTGAYVKTNVIGAGDATLNSTAIAVRSYVGSDASNAVALQSYGIQAFSKHGGTGAIDAMSAGSFKLMITDGACTANNSINAGHFHISGGTEEGYTAASGVTCPNFDGVMIEAYPDVLDMDSMLKLAVDTGAVVDSAIKVSGALAVNFLEIAAASTGVVVAAGSGLTHDPNAVTSDAYLVVKVGATSYAMPLYEI
jgi:hypothetical protein